MSRISRLTAIVALLFCRQVLAANSEPQRFTVVLDCSEGMRSAMVAPREDGGESLTRLDVAVHAVKGWLAQLSLRQKCSVNLLLGDNAKADVAGSSPLTSTDLMKYVAALDACTNGGAALPLDAIRRVAESLSSSDRSEVIFVTCNDASAQSTNACSELLKVVETPVHVISLGSQRSKEQPYLQIAKASGGSAYQATDERQALAALCKTAGLISAGRLVRAETLATGSLQDSDTDAPQPARPDKKGTEATPEPLTFGGKTETANVVIDVTYYDQRIKDAKIYLRGEHFDIVYDRSKETRRQWYARVGGTYNDPKPLPPGTVGLKPTVEAGGSYIFEEVPFGKYKMEVFAVVKNRAYVYEREFIVAKPNKDFDPIVEEDSSRYRFKVLLEKTK
jgi:hypothetical protein